MALGEAAPRPARREPRGDGSPPKGLQQTLAASPAPSGDGDLCSSDGGEALPLNGSTPKAAAARGAGGARKPEPTPKPKPQGPGGQAAPPPQGQQQLAGDSSSSGAPPRTQRAEEELSWLRLCRLRAGEGPLTISASMAKANLGDAGMQRWCDFMAQRLQEAAARGQGEGAARSVRAPLLDFSFNGLGRAGVMALCSLLEAHRVRCAVVIHVRSARYCNSAVLRSEHIRSLLHHRFLLCH